MASPAPASSERPGVRTFVPADSYGLVLMLIVLDYFAVSTLSTSQWGQTVIAVLLGLTFLFALRTSQLRRRWQILAVIYLAVGVVYAAIGGIAPGVLGNANGTVFSGAVLLVVTPFVILRRILTHTVVSAETILGAICVYLLLGFSFAAIYYTVGLFSPTPFFTGVPNATVSDHLFFSYTTLTTVGYGNLVPAGAVGQTFAMIEALFGQIYLVIIVARLVSLWGQELRPQRRSAPDVPQAETGEAEAATNTEAAANHSLAQPHSDSAEGLHAG